MDRRDRAAPPLVDSSACFCRVDRSSAAAAAAARRIPASKACVQPSLRASIHPLRPRPGAGADRSSRGGPSPLLPGLPDDLAIACLIRVPRADHWKLRLVCRKWRRLLAGNYFYGLRRRLGLAEQWLYAATRRVVFYSARSNRWHRAPDMLRRRRCFDVCVMGNRLYVAGGESGGGGGAGLRSAEVFDPAKNRWCFVAEMAAPMAPFVSAVHGGRWYVKGIGAQQQVLSQAYSPEADAWSVVLDGMVTGWRSPSACLDGRLYAADCRDGCRLRAYDEAADAWTTCVDSKQHRGSSQAAEAAAIVALHGRLCVVRNDMSVSVVDVAAGASANQRWQTLAGKAHAKSFVTGLLSNLAGRSRAKNNILHCQVLET